jgi:hypothetical protein
MNGEKPGTVSPFLPPPGGGAVQAYVRFALYGLIALLCAVTYHGISDNYLFNDDFSWLSAARYDMSAENVLTFRVVNFFRPLVNLSFLAVERAAPGNLPLNHALNLVLHFLNSILVFHLLSTLLGRRGIAVATAVLFAVSSLHTGAVFWISARTTLLSTFFLLLALIVVSRGPTGRAPSTAAAAILFALSLAAKETAIAGLPLLVLLYVIRRYGKGGYYIGAGALASFTGISTAYLIIRKMVMGGFLQLNWGPGLHAIRNLAGGFLFQLYPFPLLSLFMPSATSIEEPMHPFLPEIVVVALIAFILWIGAAVKRSGAFILAVGWGLLSIVPASAFRYRFFSTASITQNRYYYLSSVGTLLILMLLLSILWNGRSRFRRALCTALFLLLCAGSMLRVHRLEKKWDDFTGMYREVVASLVEEIEKEGDITTVAIEDPPLAFPYIADAVLLETGNRNRRSAPGGAAERPPGRPRLDVVEVRGGKEAAASFKPCLYVSYSGEYPKVMKIERLE